MKDSANSEKYPKGAGGMSTELAIKRIPIWFRKARSTFDAAEAVVSTVKIAIYRERDGEGRRTRWKRGVNIEQLL